MTLSAITAASSLPRANPMTNTANPGTGSETSTISANDFLTLLVTEMKNQDPTAQTDPNEYVNQLVQVNSLEQLIQINENLSTALGDPKAGAAGSASGDAIRASHLPAVTSVSSRNGGSVDAMPSQCVPATAGNLSVPAPNAAAHRVAVALSGLHQGPGQI